MLTLGGVTYYHAGHSDYLDSVRDIRCDVALLPWSADYAMSPEDAAQAGTACGTTVVVPLHWGEHADPAADRRRIAALFPGEVRILERTS